MAVFVPVPGVTIILNNFLWTVDCRAMMPGGGRSAKFDWVASLLYIETCLQIQMHFHFILIPSVAIRNHVKSSNLKAWKHFSAQHSFMHQKQQSFTHHNPKGKIPQYTQTFDKRNLISFVTTGTMLMLWIFEFEACRKNWEVYKNQRFIIIRDYCKAEHWKFRDAVTRGNEHGQALWGISTEHGHLRSFCPD